MRGALAVLLESQPDFQVVAQTGRGDGVLPAALSHQPDVAVIGVDLPGLDGLSAAALLRDRLPTCRTLILTGADQPGLLPRGLKAGVCGIMPKHAPSAGLTQAVRDVAAGRMVVDSQIVLAAIDERADMPLSPREIAVLELAADGHSAQEIASRLLLSTGTVRNHFTSITAKLNVRTRVDAVRIARDAGWIL